MVWSGLLVAGAALAKPKPSSAAADSVEFEQAAQAYVDSVQVMLHYQQGHLVLPGGMAELTVPRGFRYLDPVQSRWVLTKLWGNPTSESLGMLFPADKGPLDDQSWAFSIRYEPVGYVQDDKVDDTNYHNLLAEMQQDIQARNQAREAGGFRPVYLLGWAARPYYDKAAHALHWAQALRFGAAPDTILNYNVRLLGRQGVLVLNAIGQPRQLPEIKASLPGLLAGIVFTQGQQYTDFNAGIDEVAAYTIGGLVAGKVLAKVGLFAVILKFWKLTLLALGGAWAGIKRFFGLGPNQS
ncbi:MAG: DUF2167 domain-containing protein [Hymenobacter sp.]